LTSGTGRSTKRAGRTPLPVAEIFSGDVGEGDQLGDGLWILVGDVLLLGDGSF
jgi:hypothetical protein